VGSVEPSPAKWPAQSAYDADSPTGILLDRIADKWTLMIHGTLEAGLCASPTCATRSAGSRRRSSPRRCALERDGLISRHAYPQVPPKVEYALTELGGSLCTPVQGLRAWAEQHIDDIQRSRTRYDGADGA
jgi:DNA-binding HxlR family transcriptional regulator